MSACSFKFLKRVLFAFVTDSCDHFSVASACCCCRVVWLLYCICLLFSRLWHSCIGLFEWQHLNPNSTVFRRVIISSCWRAKRKPRPLCAQSQRSRSNHLLQLLPPLRLLKALL